VEDVNWALALPARSATPRRAAVILSVLFPQHVQGVAMFGRLGVPELIIILVIIIVLFGASRLPEIGRGIGKGIRNFKDATKDGKDT
jgi:sec-independent protein translocase protein TatA